MLASKSCMSIRASNWQRFSKNEGKNEEKILIIIMNYHYCLWFMFLMCFHLSWLNFSLLDFHLELRTSSNRRRGHNNYFIIEPSSGIVTFFWKRNNHIF
jgi:hypothetical protein